MIGDSHRQIGRLSNINGTTFELLRGFNKRPRLPIYEEPR